MALTPADPEDDAEGLSLVYFAPADVQIARVDRNCIVKFCEAVTKDGAEVVLVCLKIKVMQSEPTVDRTVWDVFGIRHRFDLVSVSLPLKQARLENRLPSLMLRIVRAAAYPFVAARLLRRPPSRRVVLYTKNHGLVPGLLLARFLARRKDALVVFEAHVPPGNRLQRWALRRVNAVVCNGYAVREVLLNNGLVRPDRSMAIHQGFDLDTYAAGGQPGSRNAARARLGWGEPDKVAVYTGKLYWPYAEIDLLLQTATRLAADSVRLVIVGGRADHAQLWRDEAERRGIANVSFTGFVAPSEIVDYQMAADVLLSYYPSGIALNDYRSPGKLFEYMASGTPLVAADYASLREVLEDGRNALLVKPDQPELLAEAVLRLFSDAALASRLATQARADAAHYTWSARAEAVCAFICALESK